MSTRKILAAEFWAMIAILTVGAVELPKPGVDNKGKHKLPAPRNYGAAALLFLILGFFAQVGARQSKLATKVGGTAVLAALLVGVAGPGASKPGESIGLRTVNFLNHVSNLFAPIDGAGGATGAEPEQPAQPPEVFV